MNTLLIRANPVDFKHKLYVFNGNTMLEVKECTLEEFDNMAFALIKKYNIEQVNLGGSKSYAEGLKRKIKETGLMQYNISNLRFQYV